VANGPRSLPRVAHIVIRAVCVTAVDHFCHRAIGVDMFDTDLRVLMCNVFRSNRSTIETIDY